VLYIAASVDGFVADADGDVAWLEEYGDDEGTDRYEAFLRQGLVDVLRLHVVPVVLGRGVALFDDAGERTALTLVDATTLESGIVELHYRVAG
jgi:dihydrofolate reductase